MTHYKKKLYYTIIQDGKGCSYHWDKEKDVKNSYVIYYGLNSIVENIEEEKDNNIIAIQSPNSGSVIFIIEETISFLNFLKNIENNPKKDTTLIFPKNKNDKELGFSYQDEKLTIEPLQDRNPYVDNIIIIPLSEIYVFIAILEEIIFKK